MSTLLKTELAKFDQVAAEIKTNLPNLDDYVINGVWDDQGLDSAKAAHRRVRSLVNDIERTRKAIKEPIVVAGRAVDDRAKELVKLTEPTDMELKRRIADIEMQREAIKQQKRHERTQQLTGAGFTFFEGAYRVGDQVVVASAIDDATDDEWSGIIERGKAAAERVRKEREAMEAERERIRLEREAMEAEKRELEKLRCSMASVNTEDAEPAVFEDEEQVTGQQHGQVTVQVTDQVMPEHIHLVTDEYRAGFDACRTLAMEIVKKCAKKSEMIAMLDELEADA